MKILFPLSGCWIYGINMLEEISSSCYSKNTWGEEWKSQGEEWKSRGQEYKFGMSLGIDRLSFVFT